MTNCVHKKKDIFFLGLIVIIFTGYFLSFFYETIFLYSIKEFLHKTWPALVLGTIFVGILHYIPNSYIYNMLGQGGFWGILRASVAGILLDLCSHGILMVACKLYKKGLSNGQIIAFLIASPWNSLSLTIILIGLIGLKWSFIFIFLSFIIAIFTGCIFELFTHYGYLKTNPYKLNDAKIIVNNNDGEKFNFFKALKIGIGEAKLLVKWLFFGILLISLIREFIEVDIFSAIFAPSLKGLFFTIFVASLLEVCSEGSAPLASDIFNQAKAKGNSFAFLMAGAATDYTEIMLLKETTKSWRFSLLIPLICLPQIAAVSFLLNFV